MCQRYVKNGENEKEVKSHSKEWLCW